MTFPGVPEDIYEYANEFDYSVWTPGTRVTLCNVAWDSTYRDVVWWDSEAERAEWLASLSGQYADSVILDNLVYLRYGEPVRVNVQFSVANKYNYLVVENPAVPSIGWLPQRFYYFVTDVAYVAPNTTQLNIQLDVWATYYDRLEFGYCYVERGHIGVANSNATRFNLADYLTDDEGLNIGDEYEVVAQHAVNLSPVQTEGTDVIPLQPYVLFMMTCDLTASGGTLDNPSLTSSPGAIVEGIPQGCNVYVCKGQDFVNLMRRLKDQPWVSQCITYITLVPETMVPFDSIRPVSGFDGVSEISWYRRAEDSMKIADILANFKIPSAYQKYLKLYTAPYCVLEVTAQNGGEIVAKPECIRIASDDSTMMYRMYSLVPPDVRMMVFFDGYNAAKGQAVERIRSASALGVPSWYNLYTGEALDLALAITDFPQLSVVNDSYQLYMANNRNALNYQYQSAGWGQQKALAGAQLSYDQASKSRSVIDSMLAADLSRNQAETVLGNDTALMSGVASLAGGLASGNPAMGALGAVGQAATSIYANMQSHQIAADYMRQTSAISADQLEYNRDTNYQFANFAANGDYQNAIAAIQAKVEDAKMTQPTTAGQIGGMAFNYVNGMNIILFKWKRLKPNYMAQVAQYFGRYGYYVNRFLIPPPALKCMDQFDYWKMKDVQITSTAIPESFKQTLRGILEKGVTIYRRARDVGHIDPLSNSPLEGVSY